MTYTIDLFPDAEAAVSIVLRAAIPGARVYSSVPRSPTYPLVRVSRVGGTAVVPRRLDAADVQIDVWADKKSEARTLAAQVRQALLSTEGLAVTIPSGNAIVTGVDEVIGLSSVPDAANPPKDRYLAQYRVYLHAA
jgi:hypothetical protein